MGTRAVRRIGGLGLGLVLGAMAVLGASFRSARPPDATSRDVHAEYVKFASGADSITAYIAYPESANPAPAVVVIHEVFGMSDFVRDATRRLAQEGFVALAPDLLSRSGGTPASPDDARKLIASLDPDKITQDLDAAATYVGGLKAVDAYYMGVIGFCWGGGESLRYAAHNRSLRAFVVCYGPVPKVSFDLAQIKAKGFGVYADRDARVTGGLYNLVSDLQKARVRYKYTVYSGAGHGFLRTGEPPAAANEAWRDIISFLKAELAK